MSKYNLNNNHPLIPNQNSYICERKYVSIHSIDRDSLKYPNSSLFEIELPQDYLNVQSIRLYSWSFPSNYSVFNRFLGNIYLVFQFTDIYNPTDNEYNDPLQNAIYAGLNSHIKDNYIITIEDGFYNPTQMAIELTNKMNAKITDELIIFFNNNIEYNFALALFSEYNDFVVSYNSVGQKLWFGNKSSGFVIQNDAAFYRQDAYFTQANCLVGQKSLPSFSNWGLPSYLGFSRCAASSFVGLTPNDYRFFYLEGTSGFWIKPSNLPGAKVHYISAPLKINFMGPAYIYMELDSNVNLNCIDETEPYELDKFTSGTNVTNGVVNSAFAKIAVPTTPISQWFDNQDTSPYKWFDPPLERIRRLKIRMRYHDGSLVDFAGFDYSIMLELTLLNPQFSRNMTVNKLCNA